MDEGLLSLRWNDHGLSIFNMLSNIRKNESFCDVTLTCDGFFYPVHKFVLSTCSDFFYQIFEKTPCKHPVIIIANVNRKDLEALLNYMYLGEVSVFRTELKSLVKAAEILKIKGLAEQTENSPVKEKRSSSSETDQPESKRTKSEDYFSVYIKQKESERSHVKNSNSKSKILDSNALNDQDRKDSEVTIDDSLDSVGEFVSAEVSESRRTESSSESNQDPPEVKVEDIFVKEELSDSWYEDAEAGMEDYQYGNPETGLSYDTPQTTFHDNGASWELATAQAQATEGGLPSRVPGPSRLQGVPDRRTENNIEDQRERYRNYDAKRRSRNFVEHWRSEFGWVYYDTNMRVMTCTTCLKYGTKYDKKTRFVSGNSNFKRLALVRHEMSQTHRRCEARRKADLALSNSATPAQSR
ncbi:protein abrupt-like isoform X4 [Penaeus japonicus]|uniref:protein abrupt-like isoform X4 n=1 Tax=Penaeus japonicus TaxID=27405 RepID=UPI001C711C75|nr:protein abrupt-like isoform X4 [Penaeus japonicus]